MWKASPRDWALEQRDGDDLEEHVTDWIARQEPTGWLASMIVLGILLFSIVLFAVSR